MSRNYLLLLYIILSLFLNACSKSKTTNPVVTPPVPSSFSFNSLKVNGGYNGFTYYNINQLPIIQLSFSAPLNQNSVRDALTFKSSSGNAVAYTLAFTNNDSSITIQPSSALQFLTKYMIAVSTALLSKDSGNLQSPITVNLITAIDSTDKFPRIPDDSLLTLVQKQTFKYFWDFGHPVSGMARERNTSGDVVTTGGSGFGIMAMIVAANRGFISRTEALNRVNTITHFLTDKCTRYHGAFAHWINGATGATIPFSSQDNGADLVETSYLMQGLLCARQYFNGNDTAETALRDSINSLWDSVGWNWFRQNNQNVLYWHYSNDYQWAMNVKIQGWNEALITYVLAASSRVPANAIPKEVYTSGWAQNGSIINGNQYFGITLPLGPPYGGPLFFAHYSFLGINPQNLSDMYANYWTQNTAHTSINYQYCVNNSSNYYGYSNECWGLTASDELNGYSAHSPANDNGTISPTAAISSLPYDSAKCMSALRFFYYKLGDKLWGEYGFKDAFNLTNLWFADSYLAIDQGPEIVMIENYRTGLLWKLFMSCPEVKNGMRNLGFQSPNLK